MFYRFVFQPSQEKLRRSKSAKSANFKTNKGFVLNQNYTLNGIAERLWFKTDLLKRKINKHAACLHLSNI